MWDRVLIGFNDLISKAEAMYTSKAAGVSYGMVDLEVNRADKLSFSLQLHRR